jgi:hypothetical protein
MALILKERAISAEAELPRMTLLSFIDKGYYQHIHVPAALQLYESCTCELPIIAMGKNDAV